MQRRSDSRYLPGHLPSEMLAARGIEPGSPLALRLFS